MPESGLAPSSDLLPGSSYVTSLDYLFLGCEFTLMIANVFCIPFGILGGVVLSLVLCQLQVWIFTPFLTDLFMGSHQGVAGKIEQR